MKKISALVGAIIIIIAAIVLVGGVFAYQYFSVKIQPIIKTDQTAQIKITSPNGGETYQQDSDIKVKWSVQNIGNSTLEFDLLNGDGSFERNLASMVNPDTGSQIDSSGPAFVWTAFSTSGCCGRQAVPMGQYKIRISLTGNSSISDISDNYFSIVAPTVQTAGWKTYTGTAQYRFAFKYPTNYIITDGVPNSATVGDWFVWVQNQDQSPWVAINIFKSNLTLDVFVSNEKSQTYTDSSEAYVNSDKQTTLNGISARELVYSYSGKSSGTDDIFYIKSGSLIFRIAASETAVDAVIQHEIINSFTFGQ